MLLCYPRFWRIHSRTSWEFLLNVLLCRIIHKLVLFQLLNNSFLTHIFLQLMLKGFDCLTCLFVVVVFLIPRHKVDGSAISKQLPSLILYEGGKETKRRPLVDRRGVITKYTFTEVGSCTCLNMTAGNEGDRDINKKNQLKSRTQSEIYFTIFV